MENIQSLQRAEELWKSVSGELEKKVGIPLFNQWFASIVPLSFDASVLELGVSDNFFADWLRDHYLDLMENIVNLVYGEDANSLKIEFRPGYTPAPVAKKPVVVQTVEKIIDPVSVTPVKVDGCNPSHTFENFVVGDENQIAYFSALRASQNPGEFNPLFIYGGSSLGKTHLLEAISQSYAQIHPKSVVKYITCEWMMNDYTSAILSNNQQLGFCEFRNRYRNVDILLVDDVQFLGSKERLQEEFFNTFNTLHHMRKQIVLASDRPPADINGLESRLVTRFESGLTVEITAPSYETRLAVLRKFRERVQSRVGDDVIEFIARRVVSHMRGLLGAMTQLQAWELSHAKPPTLAVAERILSGLLAGIRPTAKPTVDGILRKVAEHYDVRIQDLVGSRRPKNVAGPRQVAMYLSRKLTGKSYPEIAEAFGGKNHATILYAFRKIESDMDSDEELQMSISKIERQLKN